MFSLFELHRKDEISRKTRSTLLPFGNKVECNVAATKSKVASTLLPVASTLLLVWTGLQDGSVV